jgi:hypothetical protein
MPNTVCEHSKARAYFRIIAKRLMGYRDVELIETGNRNRLYYVVWA